MKKVISVILAVVLVFSSLAVAATAFDDELKICIASDLQYYTPDKQIYNTDEFYGYQKTLHGASDYQATSQLMTNESSFIIDAFLDDFAQNDDCDYLLIPGDLTTNGNFGTKEHNAVVEKLKAFEEKSGKDVFVIDGNHDVGSVVNSQQFKSLYADFGYDKAVVVDEDSASYTANLGKKYRLIAVDLCDGTYVTDGTITPSRLDWITEQVKAAKEDGKYPVIMSHYSFLSHNSIHRVQDGSILKDFNTLAGRTLADLGVKVILTGHEHCNDVVNLKTSKGNTVYEFITDALSQYPCGYRTMTFTDDEVSYEMEYVNSIDTDALSAAVSGYSAEQLELLSTDLVAYAKGYFKAYMTHKLNGLFDRDFFNYQGDNKVRQILQLYVDGAKEVFNTPLYGEDGIQEKAAAYGIEIPDSAYTDCWDIATELLASHFAGDAAYSLKSTEMQIVFHTASLVFKDKIASFTNEELAQAANVVLENFGMTVTPEQLHKIAVDVFGTYTPTEYFVVAVGVPVIDMLINHANEVNNIEGTIDGYAVGAQSSITVFFEKIMKVFRTVIDYFKLFFKF